MAHTIRQIALAFSAASLFLLLGHDSALGQTGTIQPQSGLRQEKAFVPPMDPRAPINDLERQNLTQRSDDNNQSIAGLVQSIKGEDAVMEVIIGRGRLLTLNEPLAKAEGETPSIAVGDPTVLDFDLMPNSRMIRLLGKRVGITDLSIVTGNGQSYAFEIHVVYDVNLLRAYLQQVYPSAKLNITQMYEHVVIEGEAPSVDVSNQILETAEAFLISAQVPRAVESQTRLGDQGIRPDYDAPTTPDADQRPSIGPADDRGDIKPSARATAQQPRIINLIRVPGVQQIMLQVRIAELDRTAFRRVGVDWFYRDSHARTFGSRLGTGVVSSGTSPGTGTGEGFLGLSLGANNTAFAIIPNATVSFAIESLRNNQVLSILAEPNLVAMHGQPASFLAGGEFPIPVPQQAGGIGAGIFTIQYKEFGVLLNFVPYIMPNGAIRLNVAPEVSTIDEATGITANGFRVPGINTRRANSTVELHQGQTLALAGLLQAELEANTDRLPGLGDLPYLGTFFSNSRHERVEKELIILVTPYLVDGMEADEIGCLPGQEVRDPNDHEFYLLNRIEGRNCDDCYRATHGWYNNRQSGVQQPSGGIVGPYGFSK